MSKTAREMAEVMLESEKPGVVVGFRERGTDRQWTKLENPHWDWHHLDYCVLPPEPVMVGLESVKGIVREVANQICCSHARALRSTIILRLDELIEQE